ncbi:twin-arginine translocase subunit TatC [bacterium]|nr:MAG: twin-arginine translocase subunit TatC [bacterium]
MTDTRPEDDIAMTIWEHLGEFRNRVVRAAAALFLTTAVAWAFRVKILAWLVKPYENSWMDRKLPGIPELQTLSPADVFVGYLQLSLVAGVVGAAPVIFYQLWAFVSPGLYSKEKRLIVPFVAFSTLLFLSGVAFAYYVAFPFTIDYFFSLLGPVSETGTVLTQRPTLEFYLDFVTRMLLAFGFVFELPLFISFLVLAGIVTPQQLVKFSRWAILLSFALGAVVTPGPEISSQIAVSAALSALYFLSIGIAFVLQPTAKPEEAA